MSEKNKKNTQHDMKFQSYDQIRISLNMDNADRSIEILKTFLLDNPEHAEAHNDIAVLYYQQQNLLQTLGHYEKAVRLDPNNTNYKMNLASFYFVEMGWSDEAIYIFTDILKAYPSSIDALSALANISITLGRVEEALVFLRRVLQLQPSNVKALEIITHLNSRETTTSTREDQPSVMSAPAPPQELDSILAGLHATLSRLETAASPQELYQQALSARDRGDEQDAFSRLQLLVDKYPTFALAHNDLGVIYQQRGDTEKSLHHHEAAVLRDPANATFKRNLAGLYFSELGRNDDAIFILTELLRSDPNNVETLSGLAQIALAIGRSDEAVIFLDKIVELDPHNVDAGDLLNQLQNDNGFFLTSS